MNTLILSIVTYLYDYKRYVNEFMGFKPVLHMSKK